MTALLFSLALLLTPAQTAAQTGAPTAASSAAPTLLSADEVEKLLPPSVFFHGQTARLQLRNAAAARFADGPVVFASLVDTSGYSTGVRERYQFYLVAETPLSISGKNLPAGAYGAGFLEDGTMIVMDIGGHDILSAQTERDAVMVHPRPLQFVPGSSPQEIRLYLGRSFVTLSRTQR